MNYIDLTNIRFGNLVVIELTDKRNNRGELIWKCKCDCGNIHYAKTGILRSGQLNSCGCLKLKILSNRVSLPDGVGTLHYLLNRYKNGARRRKLSFELTEDEFSSLTKRNCIYCGDKPKQLVKSKFGRGDYLYNGIDRINSSKGYVMENCVSCCGTCNKMKMSMSENEFLAHISKIYDNRFHRIST